MKKKFVDLLAGGAGGGGGKDKKKKVNKGLKKGILHYRGAGGVVSE